MQFQVEILVDLTVELQVVLVEQQMEKVKAKEMVIHLQFHHHKEIMVEEEEQ